MIIDIFQITLVIPNCLWYNHTNVVTAKKKTYLGLIPCGMYRPIQDLTNVKEAVCLHGSKSITIDIIDYFEKKLFGNNLDS